MSRRIRNLLIAVGLSAAMWALIIQGSFSVYHFAFATTDLMTTASVEWRSRCLPDGNRSALQFEFLTILAIQHELIGNPDRRYSCQVRDRFLVNNRQCSSEPDGTGRQRVRSPM